MSMVRRAVGSRLFRRGLLLFILGSGPLFAVIAAAKLGLTRDPNPNPIGFGILAMFTFWPAVGMMAIGLWTAWRAGP
jgi:hypothetical protein